MRPPESEGHGEQGEPGYAPLSWHSPQHALTWHAWLLLWAELCLWLVSVPSCLLSSAGLPIACVLIPHLSSPLSLSSLLGRFAPCARALEGETSFPSCRQSSLRRSSHAQGTRETEQGLTPDQTFAFAKHPCGVPPSSPSKAGDAQAGPGFAH